MYIKLKLKKWGYSFISLVSNKPIKREGGGALL